MKPHARALKTALTAARAAGDILLRRRSQTRVIRNKGRRDIVTDADLAANRTIRSILSREFPDYAWLSEEDPPEGTGPRRPPMWVVDPLDGTTNYSRDYPVYAVSIALLERSRPQVGVVYDPVRNECFYATRGGGAYLNGSPVRPSRIAALEDAVIGFELSRAERQRRQGLTRFAKLAYRGMTGRVGGSAALSLCYVAAGRLDGYFHLSLSAWDVSAAILIAVEAGARVTHLNGRAASWHGGTYLAANRRLYPQLWALLRDLGGQG